MAQFNEETGTATEVEKKVDTPKRYKVIMVNDDYTPMEFVVRILQVVFHKSEQQAVGLMLSIHQHGKGVVGVFSFEIAEMKTALVLEMAREQDYPLRCYVEEE